MEFHIRKPVEYEKIISDNTSRNIELTRHRMAVQQLLDARDNNENLISRLDEYIKCYDNIYKSLLPTQKLQKQPFFHWIVDSKAISSSCWKFESVVSRTVLASLMQSKGAVHLKDNEYKDASKSFKVAVEKHLEAINVLKSWKWKLPSANHLIVQSSWHVSQAHHLQSMQNLCMLCVGLENGLSSNNLYKISQRATSSAAKSIAFWPGKPSTLKLCQSMQHLISSDILWEREEYGGSVERLQSWFGHETINTFGFTKLQEEFDKVPFLLKERIQVNNGAYFDPVKAVTPLPAPEEVIYMGPSDVPHPQSTRSIPEESALHEEHAQELPIVLE